MKICEICGADISSRGRGAKYCKECLRKRRLEQVKIYQAKNPEIIKQRKREYYQRTKKGTAKERREREQERLEEEESWELLRQAFGERFGRNHQHVNTMSQLEKDVAEATRLGISYGEYEARKRKGMSKCTRTQPPRGRS